MKWHIEKKQLKDLRLLENNPRSITSKAFERLGKDLEEIGNFKPIIIDNNNIILGGNQRYRQLMQKYGPDYEIEVSVPDEELTEEQKNKVIILDNTNRGEFDMDMLANEFEDILKDLEINDLLPAQEELEAVEDDYEIPEEITTNIQYGDIYQIGQHRLMCGDSTDSDQVAKLMNGEKADLVFTDPPYGISYKSPSGSGKTKRGNYDIILNDDKDFDPNCLFGYCDKIVCWGANHYANKLPNSAMWLVWDKREGDAINNNSDCELAWCSFGGSARMFHHKWNGMIKASEKNEKRVHLTQKPIELSKWAFDVCDAGNLILDLFCGSGSTMVASHQLNRRCYGMELDPKYCQVIIDRMKKLDPEIEIKKL